MQKELIATNYKGINGNYKRHYGFNTKLIALYMSHAIHRES